MKKTKLFGVIALSIASFVANANTEVSSQVRANADLVAAIQIAESYTGKLAFDAERKDKYGLNYYNIEVTGGDGIPTEVWVDMNQRRVVDARASFADQTIIDNNVYWHVSVVNDWNISLVTALKKAERMSGYNALRADYDNLGSEVYEIDLISATGHTMEVHITAENDYGH